MLKEYCAASYTFDSAIPAEDPLADQQTVCNGNTCSHCSVIPCDGEHLDYLFDLKADPREAHNLIEVHPEVSVNSCLRLTTLFPCLFFAGFSDINHSSSHTLRS